VKQIEREVKISFNMEPRKKAKFTEDEIEEITEHAVKRAIELHYGDGGYLSGELFYTIQRSRSEIECDGWWHISEMDCTNE